MKILIADDEPVQRRVLESWLVKWGHEVVVAKDGAEAWSVLQADRPPLLAILDWMMPGMNGLQVCQELRKSPGRPYVYTLLLTSKNRKQDLVDGLEGGADDFLKKPFDSGELKARLETGMRILTLQADLVFASNHDALTGLLNRRAILETLHREFVRASREHSWVGVLVADLDHFKEINDTFGHLRGDAVLRRVAQIMQSNVRVYDSVGRYGGEEFLIVLPRCHLMIATERADQIRRAVNKQCSVEARAITLSLGVTADSGHSEMERVLHVADAALYRAKREGRNRVEFDTVAESAFNADIPQVRFDL